MDLRALLIIKLLLNSEVGMTVSLIAEKLDLSERTIYKELNNVRAELNKFHISLVSESKLGFRLDGSLENLEKLKSFIETKQTDTEWNSKNRLDMLCLLLLSEKDFTKAVSMSLLLDVSVATIHNDLKLLGKKLQSTQLSLMSKMGEGYLIDGDYLQMAMYTTQILMEYIDDSTFYSIFQKGNCHPNPIIERILKEYGYKDILSKLRSQIGDIIVTGFNLLSDIQVKQFVFDLMLFIKYHTINKILLRNISDDIINDKAKVFTVLIEESLENNFKMKLKRGEINYLVDIIQRYCRVSVSNQESETRWYYVNKTKELIMLYERRMKVTLEIENDFYDMIVEHLFGAVSRIKDSVSIKNPLCSDIEKNYPVILNEVVNCLKIVFPNINYSRDESSFIALYFIAAMEKSMKRTLNALIICSSGMGSSKMLESRLEKEIPEINVRKTISLMTLEQEDLSKYDLVFSTIPLEIKNFSYLIVNPLLLEEEIIKIRNIVRKKGSNLKRKSRFYSTIFDNKDDIKNDSEFEEMINVLQFGQRLIERICILSYDLSENSVKDIYCKLTGIGFDLKNVDVDDSITMIPKTRIGFLEFEQTEEEIPSLVMLISKESHFENTLEAVIVMVYSKHVSEFMMDIISIIFEILTQELRIFLKRMNYEELMKKIIEKSVKKYLYNNYCKEI